MASHAGKVIDRLLFATRNRGKLVELRALCADLPITIVGLDEAGVTAETVEDGRTFEENARKKAEEAARLAGIPALADDSGLEVDGLRGAPGVDSAVWAGLPSGRPGTDEANNAKLCAECARLAAPRAARYRCVLALAVPGEETRFEQGSVEGEIVLDPRGDGGFGYDPYFLLPALGRTMAEISLLEKNALSHRGKAMRAMAERLRRRGVSG